MEKKFIKIKLNDRIKDYFLGNWSYYCMIDINQFICYFLIDNYNYIFIENENDVDISIWNEQLEDNLNLNENIINMIISIENLNKWTWFLHYNNYNNYNNNKINIYLYNHIDSIYSDNNFIAIPLIHFYINYFNKNNYIYPSVITNFNEKKFCLCINKSNLNHEIIYFIKELEKIETIDYIKDYSELTNKSCYNSIELINVLNKYKFILCIENSYSNGYITEKIFNCFFSKSIPIYKGSPVIENYINKDSFINFNEDNLNYSFELIKNISNDENLYNNFINSKKISNLYYDENYKDILYNFIENKLKKI